MGAVLPLPRDDAECGPVARPIDVTEPMREKDGRLKEG
jgi:hypothetical protein